MVINSDGPVGGSKKFLPTIQHYRSEDRNVSDLNERKSVMWWVIEWKITFVELWYKKEAC